MDEDKKDERYEVENEDIKLLLRSLGHKLGLSMPPGWGFALFLFSYGEGGSMFYISSAQREDIIKSLQEFLAREGVVSSNIGESKTSS